jgi:hypothetical protein
MGLKLTISNPLAYVKAVSGLFVTKKRHAGLTSKEMQVIAKLIEHSEAGVITMSTRKKAIKELALKPQNFYNAMVDLKAKQAISGDELHAIFTSDTITIRNAINDTISRRGDNEGGSGGVTDTLQPST